jgi:hypothetical protein
MNLNAIQKYVFIYTALSILIVGVTKSYAQQPVTDARVTFHVA